MERPNLVLCSPLRKGIWEPVNMFSGETEGCRHIALAWGRSTGQAAGGWSVTCGGGGGPASSGRQLPSILHHRGWSRAGRPLTTFPGPLGTRHSLRADGNFRR